MVLVLLLAGDPAWLDVPYVRQTDAGCGAASVAMVMQYWVRFVATVNREAADGDKIYKLLSSSGRKGVSGEALKGYLEKQGFEAFVFNGEPRDLREHLAKGRPVMVCLAPGRKGAPLHYAVVVGVTDADVLLNDPARGKLFRQSLDRFERDWKATGNWALLAVPGAAF